MFDWGFDGFLDCGNELQRQRSSEVNSGGLGRTRCTDGALLVSLVFTRAVLVGHSAARKIRGLKRPRALWCAVKVREGFRIVKAQTLVGSIG